MKNSQSKFYDAFPNAPGLSKFLGLIKEESPKRFIGWGPWKKQWYSICSIHGNIRPDCDMCCVGNYRWIIGTHISRFFNRLSHKLWVWWVNRNNPNRLKK